MSKVRIFNIGPTNGQIANGATWTGPIIPIRGATTIAFAFKATGGGAGTLAINHRMGEEVLPVGADKMNEGGTGHYVASEMAWGGASADVWAYSVLSPIQTGMVFLSAYHRLRLVDSVAAVTGVQIFAIVHYLESADAPPLVATSDGFSNCLPLGDRSN